MINLTGDFRGLVKLGDIDRDFRTHVCENIEVAVAERVVEKHAVALRDGGWATHDVHDGNALREGASNAIDSGELSNPKRGDERGHLVYSGIAVGGVSCFTCEQLFVVGASQWLLTCVELIDAANPLQASIREVVKSDEVEISRDSVNRAYANLVKTAEEVLSDVDGLLEVLDANIGHLCSMWCVERRDCLFFVYNWVTVGNVSVKPSSSGFLLLLLWNGWDGRGMKCQLDCF